MENDSSSSVRKPDNHNGNMHDGSWSIFTAMLELKYFLMLLLYDMICYFIIVSLHRPIILS